MNNSAHPWSWDQAACGGQRDYQIWQIIGIDNTTINKHMQWSVAGGLSRSVYMHIVHGMFACGEL